MKTPKDKEQDQHTEDQPENLSRRGFFQSGLKKSLKVGLDIAEQKVEQQAKRWIRPPFAIDELAFISQCTRCDKCVSACPHDVIFPLPVKVGALAAHTPAMDLSNKACHLCEGWPCVSACEDNVLVLPENGNDASNDTLQTLPKAFAKIIINQDECIQFKDIDCGACRELCPVPEAFEWSMNRPIINTDICIGCSICREACITEPKAIEISI